MKRISLLIMTFLFSLSLQAKTIELDMTNTIPIVGAIDISTTFGFALSLASLNDLPTKEPIYIYLRSPGGDVEASEAIIELAKKSRRPVHTISIMAASAAFNIVQSLGIRYITSYSVLLTHNAYSLIFQFNEHSEENVKRATEVLFKVYQVSADRLKMTLTEYFNFMRSETLVRGENNLKVNTADKIINVECAKDLILAGGCPS